MGTSNATVSPTVLQLKQPGDGVTMRVTQCGPMSIGTYPEIAFVGVTAERQLVEVRVPSKSADRQLDRLNTSYEGVIGQTLTLSRSANAAQPNRPFWDIEFSDETIDAPQMAPTPAATSGAARREPQPAAKSTAQMPAARAAAATPAQGTAVAKEKKHGAALYLELTEFTLTRVAELYKKHGVPVTMEGIASCVATQFIQASRG